MKAKRKNYKAMNGYYEAYNSLSWDSTKSSSSLSRVYSLEHALKTRAKLNLERKPYSSSKKSTQAWVECIDNYDYGLDILLASNMLTPYKEVWALYQHMDKYKPDDNPLYEVDRIKIVRAKKRLIDRLAFDPIDYDPSKYLELYLSQKFYSFPIDKLNIYINAITYLHTATSFKTYDDSTINGDWINMHTNQLVMKSELKFLSRFSRHSGISRNTLTRYFSLYTSKECFSNDDIEYITKNVSAAINTAYTDTMFYNDLELIKNTLK